ncbi:MAG: aspartate aminotransferase family protein, partial [Myxococcota bacterium]
FRVPGAMPVWDFRVPGVTSMSADIHKFGYAAKGASVLLYRDMNYLRHQFFVATSWSGGIYISPTMAGTRPGGPIAAAWAAMHAMGAEGYMERARMLWEAAQNLRAELSRIPGIQVLGLPHSPVVSYTSTEIDIYAVADLLQEKGWSLDRQQYPPSIHCTVGSANLPVIDTYVADIREAVKHVRAHPELSKEGGAAVYGLMARVPVRGLVKREVLKLMESMYGPEGGDLDLDAGDDDPMRQFIDQYGDTLFGAIDAVKKSPVGRAVKWLRR